MQQAVSRLSACFPKDFPVIPSGTGKNNSVRGTLFLSREAALEHYVTGNPWQDANGESMFFDLKHAVARYAAPPLG